MRNRGNILFLILLAIILFAALTYAVNSGMRGGGKDASGESNRSAVASLFQFFDQVDAAVLRMRTTGGVSPENISFQYTLKRADGSSASVSSNSNCTSNACRIFLPDGGGVAPRTFEAYGLTPDGTVSTAPGNYNFVVYDWPYAGTTANDVVLYVTKLQPNLCAEVISALGLQGTPTMSGSYVLAYPVSNWDTTGYSIGANANYLLGKNTYARLINGPPSYCDVYHVVLIR